ncbi:DpnII family type II restriction endonuclease [Nocardia nova]|uniref:Uncharacterized protein n=1 Tax=Nocardia nova TaxID=37330 RepID=A0A2S5ZVG7_9NOCA|nr:DpnII family type II restriction endonuclease [Nocardia nova]PPJ19604.1 hypothetical protein C5F51_35145 [Nocardia nova]
MSAAVTFQEYLDSISKLSNDADPTLETAHTAAIKDAANQLAELGPVTAESLTSWVEDHPSTSFVLGLTLGMSQERLKNTIRSLYGTTSIAARARTDAAELVARLDSEFDLIRLLNKQLVTDYTFGDILAARAGGRARAINASATGRGIEDIIEEIVADLGLPFETRTRFVGKRGRNAPADLVIPNMAEAVIAIAAKGFDSTGSKLTDAPREIQEMAEVRLPKQFIGAVVDGMGWLSRKADLQRLYHMWDSDEIDGLYTLSSMDRFRADIAEQAKLRGFKVKE